MYGKCLTLRHGPVGFEPGPSAPDPVALTTRPQRPQGLCDVMVISTTWNIQHIPSHHRPTSISYPIMMTRLGPRRLRLFDLFHCPSIMMTAGSHLSQ